MTQTAYDFTFESIAGKPLPLVDFRGKVLLVVNTASQCGFTPQYKALEALHQAYRGRGLVVLGVPCDDFGGQEPGNEQDIAQFCELNFGVTFPLTSKAHVKGENAHPFYRWAPQNFWVSALARPRWNFHKYLLDREGKMAAYFSTLTSPKSPHISRAIERLL